jgi:hypothetical protein
VSTSGYDRYTLFVLSHVHGPSCTASSGISFCALQNHNLAHQGTCSANIR